MNGASGWGSTPVLSGRRSAIHAGKPPSRIRADSKPYTRSDHHARAAYSEFVSSYRTSVLAAPIPALDMNDRTDCGDARRSAWPVSSDGESLSSARQSR